MTQTEAAAYARQVLIALNNNEGVRNPAALRECLEVLAHVVEAKSKKGQTP